VDTLCNPNLREDQVMCFKIFCTAKVDFHKFGHFGLLLEFDLIIPSELFQNPMLAAWIMRYLYIHYKHHGFRQSARK